jgi:hypothetical protein
VNPCPALDDLQRTGPPNCARTGWRNSPLNPVEVNDNTHLHDFVTRPIMHLACVVPVTSRQPTRLPLWHSITRHQRPLHQQHRPRNGGEHDRSYQSTRLSYTPTTNLSLDIPAFSAVSQAIRIFSSITTYTSSLTPRQCHHPPPPHLVVPPNPPAKSSTPGTPPQQGTSAPRTAWEAAPHGGSHAATS